MVQNKDKLEIGFVYNCRSSLSFTTLIMLAIEVQNKLNRKSFAVFSINKLNNEKNLGLIVLEWSYSRLSFDEDVIVYLTLEKMI